MEAEVMLNSFGVSEDGGNHLNTVTSNGDKRPEE
jgi:hypothetical protein